MEIITHSQIIDLWPRPVDLADGINKHIDDEKRRVSPGLVRKWRARNSIPPSHWKALLAFASKSGVSVSAENLVDAASVRFAS